MLVPVKIFLKKGKEKEMARMGERTNNFFDNDDKIKPFSPPALLLAILKHFDRGHVPHAEHYDYESDTFLTQNS